MSAELILTETYAGHEYLAPPPHEMMPAIQDGIRTRRRRKAAVGAFAAVALVAGGAVAVGGVLNGGGAAPTPGTRVGAPSGTAQKHPAAPAVPVVTLTAGWLPAGSREVARSSVYGHASRSWLIARDTYLTLSSGAADKPDTFSRPITVNGRRATESDGPKLYTLQFLLPSGATARVSISAPDRTGAAQTGRRVAASVRDGQRVPVAPVEYTIGTAPSGLALRGISIGAERGTVYTYAPAAATGPIPPTQQVQVTSTRMLPPHIGDASYDSNGHLVGRAAAGRPVRGHQSVVMTWSGGTTLWVEGLLAPGRTIQIDGGTRASTLEDLYRLAASIRR
jgi:hypothetical protein